MLWFAASLCDRESVMITPYINTDEKIEKVPKEVEIRVSQISHKKRPYIRDQEKNSYHDRKYTWYESRIMETLCEITQFLCTFLSVFYSIDRSVIYYENIERREEDLKKSDCHF